MPHGFSLATLLFGVPVPESGLVAKHLQVIPLFYAGVVALILLGLVMVARRSISAGGDILPEEGFSVRNLFEMLMELFLNVMEDIIGPHYRKYAPLILSLWVYILFSNLFGLLPYFGPPTDKWSITISMALVVFFATHVYGVQAHGLGYFKHFISPVWPPTIIFIAISPVYLLIELIGHVARVLSLSIRLMANMTADHTVVSIFLMLTAPLIPVVFSGLGVIVCVLQAFIFSILATIYFSLAVAHEGGEEHEAAEHH